MLSKLGNLAYFVPFIILFAFMFTEGTLSETGLILAACMLVPTILMYIVMRRNNVTIKLDPEKMAMKLFDNKSIDDLFTTLRLSLNEAQESLHVLLYLRKKVHSNEDVAIELVHMGVLQHTVSILKEVTILDKRYIACLDLINEILHVQKAREQLFCNDYLLNEFVDSVMDAFLDLTHQIHEVEVTLSTADTVPIDNKKISTDELAQKIRTEDEFRSFYLNGYKILLTVGLLCTDNHHKVQTRIADRKGIQLLITYAFCSDRFEERFGTPTQSSQTTYAKVNKSGSNKQNISSKQNKDNKNTTITVKYQQWGLWSIFNLVCGHPANKGEFYHLGGVRTCIDILKQHPSAVEINRQGMALLLVMLANDSYCKYSITQARQMAMANSIVEVVHAVQKEFKSHTDIVTSSKGVLNVIIKDWS